MITEPTKIAVPLQGERVSAHFCHPERFSLVSVDAASRRTVAIIEAHIELDEPDRLSRAGDQSGWVVPSRSAGRYAGKHSTASLTRN